MAEHNPLPAYVAPAPPYLQESSPLHGVNAIPLVITLAAVGLGSSGCIVSDLASMTVGTGMYERPKADQVEWIKNHNEDPADMVADILRCPSPNASCVRLVPIGERDNMQGAIDVENKIMEKAAREGVVDAFFFELDDSKYQADVDYYLRTGTVLPESNLGILFGQAQQSAFGQRLIASLTTQLDTAKKYGLDAVCVDLDVGGGRDTLPEGIALRDDHIWKKTSEYFEDHPGARGIMRLGATHIRQPAPLVKNGVGEGVNIHTVEIVTDEMVGASGPITPIKALLESGVGNVAAIRDVAATPLSSMRNDFSDASLTFGSTGIGSVIIVHQGTESADTTSKKLPMLERNLLRQKVYEFYKVLMFLLFGSDSTTAQKTDMLELWMQMPKYGITYMLEDRDAKALELLLQKTQKRNTPSLNKPDPFDSYTGRANKAVHSGRYTGNFRK